MSHPIDVNDYTDDPVLIHIVNAWTLRSMSTQLKLIVNGKTGGRKKNRENKMRN